MRSARGPSSSRAIISVGTLLRMASDADTPSNFFVSANLTMAASLSSFMPFSSFTSCSARLKSRADVLSCTTLEVGRSHRHQLSANGVGCAPQQLAQEFQKKVDTESKDLDEVVICFRTRDDAGIAGIGKARARIVGKLSNDLAFAAIDDDIGDGFREVDPARNRGQMILASGAGNLDEVTRPQAAGVGQDFAGHGDVVVPCKVLNDFEGGVVERRQALAEFGLRPAFNAGDQNTKHIVEDLDLIFAEAVAFMQEKIRHLPEGANPLLRGAVPDGVFEFGDNGILLQDLPHVSFSTYPGRNPVPRKSRKSREFKQDSIHRRPTLSLNWLPVEIPGAGTVRSKLIAAPQRGRFA